MIRTSAATTTSTRHPLPLHHREPADQRLSKPSFIVTITGSLLGAGTGSLSVIFRDRYRLSRHCEYYTSIVSSIMYNTINRAVAMRCCLDQFHGELVQTRGI